MRKKMPLDNVKWVDRDTLKPNLYNPNSVATPELELLKTSIMEDGWTQPIVINDDNTIVDGFHRWTVSGIEPVRSLTGGMVPVVVLDSKTKQERELATIRHNRARGRHNVMKMGEIVADLLESGMSPDEVGKRLSMEDEEITRLTNAMGVMAHPKLNEPYSRAWEPE